MADLPSEIERINALTTNGRNTWFALLGVLVFVGITLMSVEHIDFYGVDRATTLPLVNFDVPTRYFFYAAPILVAAIYGYFHLYLIRLWDALSVAEARPDDRPLGDVINPWLVTDAALHMRARMRQDGCTTPRTMEGPAMALNLALAWVFGLAILTFLWWQSMPAREVWMTATAGAALALSLFVGAASFAMSVIRMRTRSDGTQQNIFSSAPAMGAVLVMIPCIGLLTEARTLSDDAKLLAPIAMVDEAIVERPAGWLPYPVAKAEYRDAWCARKSIDCAELSEEHTAEFESDWIARRAATLTDMRRPYWSARSHGKALNWRAADLSGAYLVGAYLSEAQMAGADLNQAQLARADLSLAQMEGAILVRAQMEGANLVRAQMEGANLVRAQMEGAVLVGAQMEGADLSLAQMEGAILSYSRLFGLTDRVSSLDTTNLSAATNDGGALRFVDLSGAIWDDKTDFRNTFLDGSVTMTDAFRARMGSPCQWIDTPVTDNAEFYSHWRWWVEKDWRVSWDLLAPDAYRNVPLPTPDRLAALGLTDCKPNQPFGPMPDE